MVRESGSGDGPGSLHGLTAAGGPHSFPGSGQTCDEANTQPVGGGLRSAAFSQVVGRYTICTEIASGGMASVHYGRLKGPAGFSRAVAIKRLHPQYAKDPEFVSMFLDEARVAARVRHPNVVAVLDVVALAGELVLVMEYVHGESLAKVLRVCQRLGTKAPVPVAVAILIDILRGLDAAHEVCDDQGVSLNLVHRDVSPQNILLAADGLSRVLDFGIAKAVGRAQTTGQGTFKGKLGYMSPEQLGFPYPITRRTDIYAVGVVLWEVLTMQRFFPVDEPAALAARLTPETRPERPSVIDPNICAALDEVVFKATSHDPAQRYETALQMAEALESAVRPATLVEVGRWIKSIVGDDLAARQERIALENAGWVSSADGMLAVAAASPGLEDAPSHRAGARHDEVTEVAPPSETVLDPKLSWRVAGRMGGFLGLGLLLVLGVAVLFLGRLRAWIGSESVIQSIDDARAHQTTGRMRVIPLPEETASSPAAASSVALTSSPNRATSVGSETIPAVATGAVVRGGSADDGFLIVIPASGSALPAPEVAPAPRRRSASKPAASSTVRIHCSPPYVLDDEGIRHMKPECID